MGKLHEAVIRNDVESLERLLARNESVDAVDANNATALMLAAMRGAHACSELLLAAGASMTSADQIGRTTLHLAALSGHVPIIRLLSQYNVPWDQRDIFGWTPLILMSRQGSLEIIEALLIHGAFVDDSDNGGWTALFHAISGSHFSAVLRLISAEANPLHRTKTGWTAFHLLSALGRADLYDMLGWQGDCESLLDNDGRAPGFYERSLNGLRI